MIRSRARAAPTPSMLRSPVPATAALSWPNGDKVLFHAQIESAIWISTMSSGSRSTRLAAPTGSCARSPGTDAKFVSIDLGLLGIPTRRRPGRRLGVDGGSASETITATLPRGRRDQGAAAQLSVAHVEAVDTDLRSTVATATTPSLLPRCPPSPASSFSMARRATTRSPATSATTCSMAATGNDNLNGGGGHDTLTGGVGNDTITGGAGNDTISYTSTLDGHDVVIGFDGNAAGGQDVLDLSGLFDIFGFGRRPGSPRLHRRQGRVGGDQGRYRRRSHLRSPRGHAEYRGCDHRRPGYFRRRLSDAEPRR